MRGIDHPEVADLAAVSAAVARLRDSTGNAGPHLRCIEAATKYLGNALRDPTKGKVGRALLSLSAACLGSAVTVALGCRCHHGHEFALPTVMLTTRKCLVREHNRMHRAWVACG